MQLKREAKLAAVMGCKHLVRANVESAESHGFTNFVYSCHLGLFLSVKSPAFKINYQNQMFLTSD